MQYISQRFLVKFGFLILHPIHPNNQYISALHMKNTKIYNVLQNFNKLEQNRLRKFLKSPYFNSDEKIVELYDLVVKFMNGKSKKDLPKETIWKKLTNKTHYDDVRFRKYCSDLLKKVESFLAYEHVENDKITKTYLTLDAIRSRKIEHLYNSYIRTSKSLSEVNSDESANSHLNKYLVEKTLYEINSSELKRLDKSNIELISQSLDRFYFSEKLRFYSSAIFQTNFIKDGYRIDFIDELIPSLAKSDLLEVPSISIYYYCYLTVIEKEEEGHYFKLKELLFSNSSNFPKNEALSLYYFAANYCIGRNNRGDYRFADELFLLYNEMVDKEIILSDTNEISPWDFKNIVQIGVFLKKYTWTEDFINEYGKMLPEQYRENSLRFNLGQLYFWQKKYEKVLEQLRDLEYEDLLASLNAKTITTMTYFEKDEYDLLDFYIESFRVYLGRKRKSKELNEERQKRYLRFLNLVKKLTKIIPGDKKAVEKIEMDLLKEKQKGLVGAKWLSEKIEELK